jgi:hypothetical protein
MADEIEEVVAAAVSAIPGRWRDRSPHLHGRPVIAALAERGYTIVRTSELERLQEAASAACGRFPRGEVIKPDRSKDFYVVWSHVVEAPAWAGTRAEAIADDCPPSRLRRADETGSSFMPEAPGCRWDDTGLIAEQRGYLPRRNLAAYVTAYMENRMDGAWDMLEPFEGETEVRRGT